MDHFFLRPEQRTPERLLEPGGNVDYERFLKEVMLPLKKTERFCYHPYDCKAGKLSEAIYITPNRINIVEGSYSCHPALVSNYNLKVFITVDKAEQMRRITIRNGEVYADVFRKKWIPMEEVYFSAYQIKEQCDICWKS
jgi:uridine kinase